MRFIRFFAVWERSWVKFLQKKGEVANAAAALAKEGTHFLQLLLSSCYYEVIWRIKDTPMSLISIILSYCSWNFYSIKEMHFDLLKYIKITKCITQNFTEFFYRIFTVPGQCFDDQLIKNQNKRNQYIFQGWIFSK